jgi:hypothetical protein
MSSSKQSDLQWVFAAGVYLSQAPSPSRSFLGCSSNFVVSESGQMQSVKLLQNMVYHRTQHHPPPHPFQATYCLYILYFDTVKGVGGGGWGLNQRDG